ncbi:MAG: hypothetical protein KF881_13405 [Acidobacteria bacterium]|nr:hypothetical protein [Acidobacteriota bacterium]
MNQEQKQLAGLLEAAVQKVYEEPRFLLSYHEGKRKGLEQSFAFRTGIYLAQLLAGTEFESLDLDCEYNKCYGDPKKTKNFPKGVKPDLLLHERNTNDKNKLAVEFKGYWSKKIDRDIAKLKDLTDAGDSYQYVLGVLGIIDHDRPHFRYVVGGREYE